MMSALQRPFETYCFSAAKVQEAKEIWYQFRGILTLRLINACVESKSCDALTEGLKQWGDLLSTKE